MARRPIVRFLTEEDVKPRLIDMNARPRRKKAGTPERDYQETQVEYLRRQFPSWVIAAVPNEEKPRSLDPGSIMRFNEKRRKKGVCFGFPDVLAFGPHPICLLIENKAKDGKVSENQAKVRKELSDLGWCVHYSKTLDDLQAYLRSLKLIR